MEEAAKFDDDAFSKRSSRSRIAGGTHLYKNLITLAGLACCASGLAQIDLNRVVATVNGEEIRATEYYRRLETLDLRDAFRRFGERMLDFPLGFIALDQLINERVLFQLAKQKGSYPTDVEVRAEQDRIVRVNEKLLENWANSGRTPEELTYRVRYELTNFKLLTHGINLTDLEIEKHYKDNPTLFTIPKKYKLRLILVTDPAKKAVVDAELASGKPFAEVAKAHSEDVSKLTGGDYGEVAITALPELYGKPISETKIGSATPWIDGTDPARYQSVKFLVEGATPESLRPLDANLKQELRRQLMMDRGRAKNDLSKELNTALANAKIVILQKEYAEPYKKMLESLKQSLGGTTQR